MAYREFIETKAFTTTWTELELTDDDLRALQNQLLDNPQAGPVIRHTNGARKISIPFEGKGKSGSGRVIYVDIEIRNRIHLITAYPKNQQETLTPNQKQNIGKVVKLLMGE